MDIRTRIREIIITSLENIHERRKLILALSCTVVFMTTYVLILPAFTLDKEEAAEQGGIDVPAVEQSVDADVASEESQSEEAPAVEEKESEETKEAEETKAHAEEPNIKEDKTPSKKPAEKEAKKDTTPSEVTLQNDDSNDFSIAVEGKDAGLSEDMSIKVREIDQSSKKLKKEYDSLYSDALEAVQKEEGSDRSSDFAFAKFYDISLMDGKDEVEPDAAVDVKIAFGENLQKELKVADTDRVYIVHFAVDKNTGKVTPEVLDTDATDITVRNNKVTEAAFTTDSFSVFAVVYTVDFHYELDGKKYDFSIDGGGYTSFAQLVEKLKISNVDTDTFLADVDKVEFSDPELVWTGKVDNDTTVGELKQTNGLEPEYSDDLTEEQIAGINDSVVKAGDWALISLRPFISAETLTVTMKNGEMFTIQVTDAQISAQYLSDNGDLYDVTVYYDDEAQIPDDATLKVTPYEDNSDEYNSIRDIVLEQTDTDQEDTLRTLDISIVGADGQVIEPETPVRVEMVIKNLGENPENTGDSMTVLHLDASSGNVKVETVANAGDMGNINLDEETAAASFTLDSFSQFAITYENYVKVNVHYVDVNGNELSGRTNGVTAYNNTELTLANYSNRMTQTGYTYLGAHYGTSSGQVITSLKATNTPTEGSLKTSGRSVTFYNGTNVVARQEYENSLRQVDVYLVYAPSSGYYILDTIGEDGCLSVHDENGLIQTGSDQNLYVRWYRSDNGTTDFEEVTQSKSLNGNYNLPELDGPKVNVSIDEGADKYYKAEIYKVEDNKEIILATTDTYHVPYYDDVQNGGFETPDNDTTNGSGRKWPSNWQVENGQEGVIWKTTGIDPEGNKKDIEIPQGANANGQGANNLGDTLRNYCFAFMPEGNQCAELNCEAAGALYQDVLTIPGSQLYWSLYHRARGAYDYWKERTDKTQNRETDTMYVIAMPKELAEKYDVTTQEKVLQIVQHVNDPGSEFHDVEIVKITTTNQGNGTMRFINTGATLTVPPTYFGNLPNGRTATVYDSVTKLDFTYGNTDWHYYTGNFSIPQDQYLTRFFFVAGETASHNNTMGNFLDCISMSDSVPTPNHGQATVIIQKTVNGLNPLPENYATRIETTYETTKHNTLITPTDKNSDYDHYRTEIDSSGNAVSTASWTFPISIDHGDHIVFTKGEEKAPEASGKTDVVEGYTQTTSYILRKQSVDQTEPTVVAQGSGKVVTAEDISKLTVNEKDVIYIEFVNTYTAKRKVSICKTDLNGNVIHTGAAFALYKADDFDDTTQKPKANARVITSGTTGQNGILDLGELEAGEYRLVETHAPDGFVMLDSAIKITVTDSTVTAMLGTSNLTVVTKGNESWIEGQADDTVQINVWNNPGVELPSTGGPGTTLIYILGFVLTGIAGAGLVIRKRRKAA